MSTPYQKGAKRENDLCKRLRLDGWTAYRSAGSHGHADVIALREGERPMLCQVKASKQRWSGFGTRERVALMLEAANAGAQPVYVHWPPDRKGPRFLHTHDWPPSRNPLTTES